MTNVDPYVQWKPDPHHTAYIYVIMAYLRFSTQQDTRGIFDIFVFVVAVIKRIDIQLLTHGTHIRW